MYHYRQLLLCLFFFFNDTATTEIYTLSLHDALPICGDHAEQHVVHAHEGRDGHQADRKSTRLNSSHLVISYAVFCLKKKKSTAPSTSCRTFDTNVFVFQLAH